MPKGVNNTYFEYFNSVMNAHALTDVFSISDVRVFENHFVRCNVGVFIVSPSLIEKKRKKRRYRLKMRSQGVSSPPTTWSHCNKRYKRAVITSREKAKKLRKDSGNDFVLKKKPSARKIPRTWNQRWSTTWYEMLRHQSVGLLAKGSPISYPN